MNRSKTKQDLIKSLAMGKAFSDRDSKVQAYELLAPQNQLDTTEESIPTPQNPILNPANLKPIGSDVFTDVFNNNFANATDVLLVFGTMAAIKGNAQFFGFNNSVLDSNLIDSFPGAGANKFRLLNEWAIASTIIAGKFSVFGASSVQARQPVTIIGFDTDGNPTPSKGQIPVVNADINEIILEGRLAMSVNIGFTYLVKAGEVVTIELTDSIYDTVGNFTPHLR